MESPPLLRETVSQSTLADFDPTKLDNIFFDRKPHQVGRYFEALIEFWLTEIRQAEMVERGLQVQDEVRTLGELDFVFRDEDGILTHWETAVKFYLHQEGEFIGPNAADTLERKFNHLTDHQIQLGQTAIPEIQKSELFVKGRLYYHPSDPTPDPLPEYVGTDHLRGTWIHVSELDWLEENQGYQTLDKPHWFTGSVLKEALSASETREFLAQHFQSSGHPVHLMDSEQNPVFVVCDKWPKV